MSARTEHVGAIGDRIHAIATVYFVKVFAPKEREYSYTYLVLMCDDGGHRLKIFYSGRKWLPMKGQQVDIVATVKAHEHYDGVAVTELERPKVKDMGVAPGFPYCEPAPLPRAEELRWNQERKAQDKFMSAARGIPHAR